MKGLVIMTPVEIITLVFRILTVLVQFITLGVLWSNNWRWERQKRKLYKGMNHDSESCKRR